MGKIEKVITYTLKSFRYARVIYLSGKTMTYCQTGMPENVLHFMRNAKRTIKPDNRYEYTMQGN